MKKSFIIFMLVLNGCFATVQQAQQQCREQFDPKTDAENYRDCVHTIVTDSIERRRAFSESMKNIQYTPVQTTTPLYTPQCMQQYDWQTKTYVCK